MSGLFELGHLVATPAALRFLKANRIQADQLVARHAGGDWGDVSEGDRLANDESLRDGEQILSAYQFPTGRVWIITDAGHAVTTVLLPEDY